MKTARILSALGALTLVIVAGPAPAEEGWLDKLNPFAKKESHSTPAGRKHNVRKVQPSPLEKLNAGTKKFFAGARDTLTGKKPASKQKATNQYPTWSPTSNAPRQASSQKKKSWVDSLFRREKPKEVESMKEWVGLPRLEP
jgi:hypothetical protein